MYGTYVYGLPFIVRSPANENTDRLMLQSILQLYLQKNNYIAYEKNLE